jgi:hypothetical protein
MSRKSALRILGVLAAAIAGITLGFMFAARDDRASQATASQADQPLGTSSSLAPSDNPPDASLLSDDPKPGQAKRSGKLSKQ